MRRLRFSLAWLIFPSICMAESTRASISAKGILTNTVCISSCRPFRNLSFFLASVSISSGAYLANDKNLSRYSTTIILPCFNSLNSSLILLIKPGGTWVLLNLTLNSSRSSFGLRSLHEHCSTMPWHLRLDNEWRTRLSRWLLLRLLLSYFPWFAANHPRLGVLPTW